MLYFLDDGEPARVPQGKPLALLGLGFARSASFFEAMQPNMVRGPPAADSGQ